jgi:type IV secretory pathway VirB2 component (pilin)
MTYVKNILSVVGAIIIAEIAPAIWSAFHEINNAKATGVGAAVGGLLESLVSPLFWIVAIALFAMFFFASRAGHTALRVTFFWIPTVTACFVAATIVSLVTYLVVLHFRHS